MIIILQSTISKTDSSTNNNVIFEMVETANAYKFRYYDDKGLKSYFCCLVDQHSLVMLTRKMYSLLKFTTALVMANCYNSVLASGHTKH